MEVFLTMFTKIEEKLVTLAENIWNNPELRFKEDYSSRAQQLLLQENGFTIEAGISNMSTAFIAKYGNGSPIIGFLGEFDALSELSQRESVSYKAVHPDMVNGHGCGHNLLGVASITAALEVQKYLQETNSSGTVIYFGCPAEEGGSGKTFMQRSGVFDNLDVAITWHPSSVNAIMSRPTLANIQSSFYFTGIASHASISPHLGRSALDAAELMSTGVNYLREHISTDARIHYAYLNAGGTSPNIVQAETEVVYLVRSPKINECKEIYERVRRIAQGAAMMTDTQVKITFQKSCTNFLPNRALEQLLYDSLIQIGGPVATSEELQFSKEIWNSLSLEEQQSAQETNEGFGLEDKNAPFDENQLCHFISTYSGENNNCMYGSSDVGDVSWTVPTAQLTVACFTNGTPFHSWQMVSQSNSSFAFKGMLKAGKIMAITAIKLIDDPSLVEPIKKEFEEQLKKSPYSNPIPPEVLPCF